MRRRAWAAFAVAGLVAAGLGMANASSIALSGARPSSAVAEDPCTAAAVVGNPPGGPSYDDVTVQLPAECVAPERTLQVTVVDSANVAHTGAATLSSATLTIPVSPAYVATPSMAVAATVDGWNLSTTWSHTAASPQISCRIPSNSAYSCTVTITRRWLLVYYYDVRISAPAGQPSAAWELTLNLDATQFGNVTDYIGNYPLDDGDVTLAAGSGCGELPLPRLVGTGTTFRTVAGGQSRTLYLAVGSAGTADVLACP